MKLLILIGLMFGVLNAESRYALLIANSDYKYIDDLNDPSKNIKRLKKSLESLNFKVAVEKNLNSEYLSEAIEQFSKRLSRDKNNIGFLYYSGHGCQLNYQGYLVPTDVDTKNKVKIKHHALSINEMLDTLSMANNRVNMFFLDACRDVPTGSRGGTKGLGQPTATPKGSLVVYATEAGKTAEDNSNFIDALIDNINKPNQNVKDIADNISNAVADKTREKQIPVVFYKRLPSILLKQENTHNPTQKYTTPAKNICESNGGKIDKYGCSASWGNAKKICSANGQRLPSLEELNQIIHKCGGIIIKNGWVTPDYENLSEKNESNKQYQTCYQNKKFSSQRYWSSTPASHNNDLKWFVYFLSGYTYYIYKDGQGSDFYINCLNE